MKADKGERTPALRFCFDSRASKSTRQGSAFTGPDNVREYSPHHEAPKPTPIWDICGNLSRVSAAPPTPQRRTL
jgi:hypothetical protein